MATRLEEGPNDFTFGDFIRLGNAVLGEFLRTVDTSQLSLALKTCPPALREKLLSNLSTQSAAIINEEIEFMGPVRLADIEEAQDAIVDQYRRHQGMM